MRKYIILIVFISLVGCETKKQHDLPKSGTPIIVAFDYLTPYEDEIPYSIKGKFVDMDSDWLIVNISDSDKKTSHDVWYARKSIRRIIIDNEAVSLPPSQ